MMFARWRIRWGPSVGLCGLFSLWACTQNEPTGPSEGAGDAGTTVVADAGARADATVATPQCTTPRPGRSPLRRLTRGEYDRTVRDLLGDESGPAAGFLPDGRTAGFDNIARAQATTQVLVEQHLFAAETIAERLVNDIARLRAFVPCDPGAVGQLECGDILIAEFLPRAFRRPITDFERIRYGSIFATGFSQSGFRGAVRILVTTVLMSPHFLYRVELPAEGEAGVVRLDDHAMASRLSYFLWGTMPDETLFEAADAGRLETKAQIEAQARRMLDDPRAKDSIASFGRQWLGLSDFEDIVKDESVWPGFEPARTSMLQSSLLFHEDVVLNGTLADLLTAPYVFSNEHTAELFGFSGSSRGWSKQTPSHARAGILTDLGVLTAHAKNNQTSPVLRGKFVREQLLCHPLPMPPENVDITVPPVDPNSTTRERFSRHREDPTCAGCHQLMDPLGFGLEHFDAVGRYRDSDNGAPIDASGRIIAARVPRDTFDGATQLAEIIAESNQVRDCLTTQWFRFGLGRIESGEDMCSLGAVRDAFSQSSFEMRELIVAITQTDAFRYRQVEQEDCR